MFCALRATTRNIQKALSRAEICRDAGDSGLGSIEIQHPRTHFKQPGRQMTARPRTEISNVEARRAKPWLTWLTWLIPLTRLEIKHVMVCESATIVDHSIQV